MSLRLSPTLFALAAMLGAFLATAPGAGAQDAVFGPVVVEGNTSTSTALILHELGVREGDPYDYDLIDLGWERLEDLGWFAFVEVEAEDDGPVVPVYVTVEEDGTTMGFPIIKYDRRWDVQLGAKIYDINLGGRGEKISFAGIWHRQHRYELAWSHPWFFGVGGLSCGVDGYWEDSAFVYRDVDFRTYGGAFWLRWERPRPFFSELRLSRSSFETDGAIDSWSDERRRRWSLSATVGLDTRDLAWYPRRGGYHRITGARHMSDDFDSFFEATGDLRQFLPLPWEHVLALRAWGRRVDGATPPEDRLYWGGPENLRGHHDFVYEGEEGWLLTAEYRWPLFVMPITADGRVLSMGLHAFGDWGANWFDGGSASPRHDYGAGVHLGLSNRQFRFEVARTDDDRTVFQFMDNFNF